jgi:hypothetical protein
MNHHCISNVIIKNHKSICTHKIHEIQKYEIFLTQKILKLKFENLKKKVLTVIFDTGNKETYVHS